MFAITLTSERLNLHVTSFSIVYVYAGMHIIGSMEVFNSKNGLIRQPILQSWPLQWSGKGKENIAQANFW